MVLYSAEEYYSCILFDEQMYIGYWLDMEIYVRVRLQSNIARSLFHRVL